MRLKTLMLADHASIREGTLGVLGGFINQLWRSEYPSDIGSFLVATIEVEAEDIKASEIKAKFTFWCTQQGSDEEIFRGEGEINSDLNDDFGAYFPLVFDIRNMKIPEPGQYVINFRVRKEPAETYIFYAKTSQH